MNDYVLVFILISALGAVGGTSVGIMFYFHESLKHYDDDIKSALFLQAPMFLFGGTICLCWPPLTKFVDTHAALGAQWTGILMVVLGCFWFGLGSIGMYRQRQEQMDRSQALQALLQDDNRTSLAQACV
eukprot:TRINITY_DN83716_c0_g1_i1.p1 TRINITY_DN83716_c0_g1~~TRINITY_DN83716_c0_g1_i1.p1  ORF type:complete len:129 (+),score=12.58 TRINITY_DN83716_c0_g1_i1:166-552(+)